MSHYFWDKVIALTSSTHFLLGYLTDVHIWELAQRITSEVELQQLRVNILEIRNFKDTIPRHQPKDAISCLAREALKIWMKKQSPEEAYRNLFYALQNHGEKRLAEELRQWVTGIPTEQSKLSSCLYYFHPPQTKLRKGNLFTSVCQEFCPRGVSTKHPLGKHPPWADIPPGRNPWADMPRCRHTPRQTPPGQKPPGQTSPWADTSRVDTPGQTPRADVPLRQTATAVDGTHPTGMHSCLFLLFQMY